MFSFPLHNVAVMLLQVIFEMLNIHIVYCMVTTNIQTDFNNLKKISVWKIKYKSV